MTPAMPQCTVGLPVPPPAPGAPAAPPRLGSRSFAPDGLQPATRNDAPANSQILLFISRFLSLDSAKPHPRASCTQPLELCRATRTRLLGRPTSTLANER